MMTVKRFLEMGGSIVWKKQRLMLELDNVELIVKPYQEGDYSVSYTYPDREHVDKAIGLFMKVYERYGKYGKSKFKDS